MTRPSPYQASQHSLDVGDRVRLVSVPDELAATLDPGDLAAVKAVVGKVLPVAGFNAAGEVELEFRAADSILHTIWVPPRCVKKIERGPRR